MPNAQGANMTNDTAAIATLNIRTTSLEGRVNELTNTVNGVQTALSTKIDSLAQSLTSKIDERGRTPWAIYISGIMAVFSLYAYIDNSKIGPLKEVDDKIEQRVNRIASKMESDMVPLWVHQKIWSLTDDNLKRTTEANTERVKRLEDRDNQTWNQRDALLDANQRIRQLEMMLQQKTGSSP